MHQQGLQFIIRQKLLNGTLPYHSIPRVWGGPGHGEMWDACVRNITKDEWVLEGISLAPVRRPLQLHTECFHLWEIERHARAKTTLPIRPVQDGPHAG